MGFFWTVNHGGMSPPHYNFVVIAPMIMKFSTGIKLDVFYTMVTKNLWRHYYYVIVMHNLYFSRHIGLNSDARNSQIPLLIWLKFGF